MSPKEHLPKAERPRGQETAISFESPQRLIKQIAWPDPGLRLKSTLSTTSPKFVYWGTHLNPEAVFFYLKERPADVILFKGEGKVWIGKNALLLIQKY